MSNVRMAVIHKRRFYISLGCWASTPHADLKGEVDTLCTRTTILPQYRLMAPNESLKVAAMSVHNDTPSRLHRTRFRDSSACTPIASRSEIRIRAFLAEVVGITDALPHSSIVIHYADEQEPH